MTREIKFRFFDGKSMCDDFLISSTGEVGLCEGLSFESGAYFDTDDYKHIIPLQRTGLKDKNGVEIYEGDIVAECGVTYSFPDREKNIEREGTWFDLEDVGNTLIKRVCDCSIYDCSRSKKPEHYKEIKERMIVGKRLWGEIKWSKKTGYEPFCDSEENCGHCGGGSSPNRFEVIGNIYENPDLLANNTND